MLASRKGKEAAHMEAQARKLFRLGRTIKILLIIVVAAVGISTLLTFWDALSCTLRPADEVVYVAEAVELRAREKALMGWGSVVYSVCTIIAFVFCIGMTQKMAADRNPFNVENVRLLRRMALLFGLTAAAVLIYNAAYAASSDFDAVQTIYASLGPAVLQVVVALLLRFLADVFEYGVELQQLSDETL